MEKTVADLMMAFVRIGEKSFFYGMSKEEVIAEVRLGYSTYPETNYDPEEFPEDWAVLAVTVGYENAEARK